MDREKYTQNTFMTIEKASRFLTEEEKKKIKELHEQLQQNTENVKIYSPLLQEEKDVYVDKKGTMLTSINSTLLELNSIQQTIEQRYIDFAKNDKDSILKDVKTIINTATKKEFVERQKKFKSQVKLLIENPNIEKEVKQQAKKLVIQNFENFCNFLLNKVRLQQRALLLNNFSDKEIYRLIGEKASKYYKKTTSKNYEVENLVSIIPKKHIIPNTKFSNELQRNTLFDEPHNLIVANKGKTNEVKTFVNVSCTEDYKFIGKPYTEYDRQVQNAVCSLYCAGNKVITPAMVFRTMTCRKETETPSEQQLKKIKKSLEKQWSIKVEIDATKEITTRKKNNKQQIEPDEKYRFKENLLNLREGTKEAGGNIITAYEILSTPIQLKYAKKTGQLLTIDASLLDIKKIDKNGVKTSVSLSNTERNITVRGYLLRRIGTIKNDKQNKRNKQSNVILFSSIFENSEIKEKQAKRSAREYTFKALEFWKKEKFIKNFKQREKGRSIDAVVIEI